VRMGQAGIDVNLVLMVVNLIPIPPLDGGRIAVSLLPQRMAWKFSRVEPYGITILLAVMIINQYTNVLGIFLSPVLGASEHLVYRLFQL
jgi:Zn-dependent protease